MNDITAKNTRKINKKTIITVAAALAVITILAAVILIFILPTTKSDEDKYNDAKRALAAGDYNKAYTLFKETTYYADSAEYLEDFTLRFDKVIRNIDGKIHVVETAYDENGNLTDETEYDDEHFKKTVKVYDENGRRIKTYRVENDE
ncbi:MAG: hypothetical protein IKT78_04795, partial [Ruminiclostridium sp.]|nr:hypothetical protein [Ruminiclostridium sp.]